jgi:hypothetical protein
MEKILTRLAATVALLSDRSLQRRLALRKRIRARQAVVGGMMVHPGKGDLHMRRNWYLLLAIAVMFAIADYNLAFAFPVNPHPLDATASDVQLARFVAGRGPGGRAFVAGRGPGGRAFVAGRGPGGRAVVAGGRYRVGGRYYGGVWYGTGRRFWGGRWWPYGVGSCWLQAPIGYVWTCG